ncbi:alpha/beta fold hydrolase [Thalassolituus sp. LLYu03]|uniref:alpha/beta fold hydrolase n=1 Tax=Thalassolituus sp. LLYu03 TaxID=3421656 RepID=UPI003D2BDDC1
MLMTMWQNLWTETGAIPLDELRSRLETPESRYIELQGMQVHYRDVGASDKPVLILLHGIFSSLHTWNEWTHLLKDDYRVISIDMPNFGLTGAHPQGMFKHIFSDFLNDFTDALNIERCYMAGNSLGGWMTWEFAARFPHKVEKLVLIDSAGFFFVPPPGLIALGLPLAGWLASHFVLPRSVMYASIRSTYANPARLDRETLNRYYELMLRPGNRAAGASVLRFIRNRAGFDNRMMSDIRQPVLVMWGKDDAWIPPAHVDRFKHRLPQAEVIRYDDCGHLPMEEWPQKTADDCRRFLQG